MRAQIEQRVKELKTEFEAGQKMLADLEARQQNLRETLLRISGAIQVLEEELARVDPASSNSSVQQDGASETRVTTLQS